MVLPMRGFAPGRLCTERQQPANVVGFLVRVHLVVDVPRGDRPPGRHLGRTSVRAVGFGRGKAVRRGATPAVPVELPWEDVSGAPRSADLLLSTLERTALQRRYINPKVWKPALILAGIEPTRENGMHALRHFSASVLLDAGESARALAEYLGHADPGLTLRVCTHLMPASERTRRAVHHVFGGGVPSPLSTACAPNVHQGGS